MPRNLAVKVRYGGWQLPTISQAQGCPRRRGIWRKRDEQSPGPRNTNRIRRLKWDESATQDEIQ